MTGVAIEKPSTEAISDGITADRKTGSKRPRGYIDWHPQAKTSAVLEKVQSIVAEYEDHWPITNRQILYRMIGRFGFEKQNEDKLYYVLDKARRARIIPFEAIRDDGVVEYSPTWYRGPDGFWDHVGREVNGYRRDRQAGQPAYMELWTEAEGMAPQLAAVVREAIESRIERRETYVEQVDQEKRDRIALTRALPSGGLS